MYYLLSILVYAIGREGTRQHLPTDPALRARFRCLGRLYSSEGGKQVLYVAALNREELDQAAAALHVTFSNVSADSGPVLTTLTGGQGTDIAAYVLPLPEDWAAPFGGMAGSLLALQYAMAQLTRQYDHMAAIMQATDDFQATLTRLRY
jgi:hypothetical protein